MFYVVPNYEFLMINEEGQCKSSHTLNILKPYTDKDGYFRIKVWCPKEKKNKGCYIHRAVALVFIPNPENKPQVNHKDSNRKNNKISNLEWVTEKENYDHGASVGRIIRSGENHSRSSLSEVQVRDICQRLSSGESVIEISRFLKIPKPTVFSIRSGQTWRNISKEYDIPEVKEKLTTDVVIGICELLVIGKSTKEIIEKTNVNRNHIENIKKRKTFKHISLDYVW